MARKPNFFIVGAQKCGTTALWEYIRTHPNIFMLTYKEPNYFNSGFSFPRYRRANSEAEYVGLFSRATDEAIAIGEASVCYFYDRTAMAGIREFNPDAKIIVMMRNPVEMVPSYHSQTVYNCEETEEDFGKAWELSATRAERKNVPKKCRDYRLLLYGEVGKFGDQLEYVYRLFPRDQVLVILMDDMIQDVKEVYERTLAFLGVESDQRTDFPRINEAKHHKDGWWGRFSAYPPDWWIWGSYVLKRTFNISGFNFLRRIREKTASKGKRAPLPPGLLEKMRDAYREDILKLSKLIDRDLQEWLESPTTQKASIPHESLPS